MGASAWCSVLNTGLHSRNPIRIHGVAGVEALIYTHVFLQHASRAGVEALIYTHAFLQHASRAGVEALIYTHAFPTTCLSCVYFLTSAAMNPVDMLKARASWPDPRQPSNLGTARAPSTMGNVQQSLRGSGTVWVEQGWVGYRWTCIGRVGPKARE
jgi:hypothetical protein